ncbi:BTAD domain-containing putative transcriptional regulator [Piscinibacter sp.]|uniref:BTAD domain-containing putative transcriptional regulator n=1 Tax=Piscinibacter sp. TaxID=1903157 RepID=UPI00355AA00D
MGPVIHLLGTPRVLRDGTPCVLRGHKVWGLLAYLVRHPHGASRRRLASLLFEDAEDPLAALRWNLSELRRALGDVGLGGDVIALPPERVTYVDVEVLARGDWTDALSVPGLGHELLDGMSFATSPGFDVWLEAERRLVRATAQSVLREAALARLASGAPDDAAQLAARLVALDPLDEAFQVLLVRCLGAAGDGVGAARQASACRELFMRELGVTPGPALSEALHTGTAAPTTRPAAGRAGVMAQLQAGEAAIGAGVLEAGLQCLRRAIVDADEVGDRGLRVRARLALGGALVHAARGRDEEGAAALHEALAIGQGTASAHAAGACRELGYVEMLRGSYERARAWMDRGMDLAGEDHAEQVRIATVRGMILSDTADYGAAIETLSRAASPSDTLGDARQSIFATSMLGRAMLLRGDIEGAGEVLQTSMEQARRLWTAFLPWPQSLHAEVELLHGRVDAAADLFEQAFALGCQLGDPCWEGMAGRGLGKVAMARGRPDQARQILRDALVRCTRLPDGYAWARAYTLDALCNVAVAAQMPRAREWIGELMALASSTGMRELVVHAYLHQAALGDPGASKAAQVMAKEMDSPSLKAKVGAG